MPSIDQDALSFIEINPKTPAKRCVIWLHGLGADGSDFVPIVPELRLPEALAIRFVFPHAPVMPITINQGYEMPAWYDISSVAIDGKIDKDGMMKSVATIEKYIAKEISQGISRENIILAGFSQGAVIALLTALHGLTPVAGVIALSGYLPLAKEAIQTLNQGAKFPIFIAHGMEDSIVPYALGKAAYLTLNELNYPVSWHSYPIAHTVSLDEIHDLSMWIQRDLIKNK